MSQEQAMQAITCPLIPDMYFSADGSDNGPIMASGSYWYRVALESDAAAAKLTHYAAWHAAEAERHKLNEREILDVATQYAAQANKSRRQALELAAISSARSTIDLSTMDLPPHRGD